MKEVRRLCEEGIASDQERWTEYDSAGNPVAKKGDGPHAKRYRAILAALPEATTNYCPVCEARAKETE